MTNRLFLFLFSLTFLAAPASAALRLSGTVQGASVGKVYLQKYIDRYYTPVDSAAVGSDGSFSFATEGIVLPEIYGLSLSLDADDVPFLVFLDEGDIRVSLVAAEGYRGSRIEGSATHDLYQEFHRERGRSLDAFLAQHPSSLVSIYVLYREYVSRLSSDEILHSLSLLSPELQQSSYADILRKVLATRQQVDVGSQAPRFSATTPEGNTLALDELLGHGYLLIDFWASWCGPCRKENPHVVAAYKQYHDLGFNILGVSLDRTRAAWLKGIADDGLVWHHVSELKFWASEVAAQYGVRSIPANVLVDKDGKIIAKNLRGADLTDLLGQLLQP